MARTHKTVVSQTVHYLSRPHETICREPIKAAAAWKGPELATKEGTWRSALTPAEIDEVCGALEVTKATGKPTSMLRATDFPLPTLSGRIAHWRRALTDGLGFHLISGLPVERWSQQEIERVFWCFGLHLGLPGAQNKAGDLLGHVIDTGADPGATDVRLYKTASRIAYHCDAADAVGLLCIRPAKEGGLSRLVSSVSVYNVLLERHPELVDGLYEPVLLDTRGEGGLNYFPVRPCRYAAGRLKTFYHCDYFRTAHRYEGAPVQSARAARLLDAYDQIASDPDLYLDMELRQGDIQLVSNHTILHARTDYVDHEDRAQRRHLLRLWLSLDKPSSWRLKALGAASGAALVAGIVKERVRQRRFKAPK